MLEDGLLVGSDDGESGFSPTVDDDGTHVTMHSENTTTGLQLSQDSELSSCWFAEDLVQDSYSTLNFRDDLPVYINLTSTTWSTYRPT
jgi:hypothetical protein